MRRYNLFDRFASAIDQTLKTLVAPATSARPIPGENLGTNDLSATEKRQSMRLMRVNHAGEIAAQGLYSGQAFVARDANTVTSMKQNAHEETDHLSWCRQRVKELDGRTSLLTPFWYVGSFSIGMFAGLVGDRWSLGFVKETEDQVVAHLQSHLSMVSPKDEKTLAIIRQIQQDESEHAQNAAASGAYELPQAARQAMRLGAKVMTTTAYYF